jgi:uncharacterized repeat protein (TIGR01451 family)
MRERLPVVVTPGRSLWYEGPIRMTRSAVQWSRLLAALVVVAACALVLVPRCAAEQASSEARHAQAGYLDAGDEHTCAILADRSVRCWGKGLAGRLGYGNESNVLTAGAAGPVNLGGHGARAIATGDYHTCAILDDGSVRCWGFGANGRLGYGNTQNVLSPANAPPVDLGGHRATAITAGASHTCVILDDGSVRCWGNGTSGRLGYGNLATIGDNETPASAGPVDIGAGRRAIAISAGDFHTCVIRDDHSLLCWGFGQAGQLGYGGTNDVGDDETPGSAGPVPLNGHGARAVSGGNGHTCVIEDDGTVHCWGFGGDGRLGYGGTGSILSAAAAPAVNLGPGRTAQAISAGEGHTCAILDTGAVRCWGFGGNGRLGYGNTDSIADTAGETPASAGPVDFGGGHTARGISVGFSDSCALLDDGTMRCWGYGGDGRLGYGNETSVGDDPSRSVALAGPVPLGGGVPSLVADLSVGAAASSTQLPLGATVTVTVTVANAGPDATAAVAVALPPPPGLVYRSAARSQGDFDGGSGVWRVGALVPGGSARLVVSVGALSPGVRSLAAEVASSSLSDPSSTPGNGAPEDDRSAVTLVTPAPPVAPVGGPDTRRAARSLSVKVVRAPKKGRAKRLTVTGRIVLPSARPRIACGGRVRVRALVGRRAVAQKTVRLTRQKRTGRCLYSAVLRPTKAKTRSARTVAVSARFLGSSRVKPRSSVTKRVRIR